MSSIKIYDYDTADVLSADKSMDVLTNPRLSKPDPFFTNEDDLFTRYSSDIKLIEQENTYIIEFPVAGYNRHHLQQEEQANQLLVRVKALQQHGKFYGESTPLHAFTLPEDADTNHIKARCRNGLLEVRVKRYTSTRKAKVIPVKKVDSAGITKRFSWVVIKNKLKNLLASKKQSRGKLRKKSWLKAMQAQRLRLRKISYRLIAAMKGKEISMIILLQALFVLIVALLTSAFFIMDLLDQNSL